jgi:hypothetical protein
MTGRTTRDGFFLEWRIAMFAGFVGEVSPNDQIGWSPFGAVIVTRMRESVR